MYYTDRDYTLTSVLGPYVGMEAIITPNNDRNRTDASDYLTFTMPYDGMVYVAFDSRATSLPDWASGFVDTGDSLLTSLATQPALKIYSRFAFAGECINLGANKAPGFVGGTVSNYIVFYSADTGGDTYTLTINTVGSGSVTRDPSGPYVADTEVELNALPAAGWQFSGWSGDLTGNANPAYITMDGNKTVTATFTQIPPGQYTLTVNTSGSGSVTRDPSGPYVADTEVELNALPAAGWQFSGWSGDLTGNANPAYITMDGNKTVTATFIEVSSAAPH